MLERARPPEDISPADFFTRWIPDAVASDAHRRHRLGGTAATIVFELTGEPGGVFSLRIDAGIVHGSPGSDGEADLRVMVDVETWRALNRGTLSAPQALLKRRVHIHGDFILALKLHLILG